MSERDDKLTGLAGRPIAAVEYGPKQKWWQSTYAVPKWIVLLFIASTVLRLPAAIATVYGWLA